MMNDELYTTDLPQHRERLRNAVRALAGNSVLRLPPPRAPIPALPQTALSMVLSPALSRAIGTGQLSGDDGLRLFVSLLDAEVDPLTALRRWMMGLRFLARNLASLLNTGHAWFRGDHVDVHERYWIFFAICDFDAFNRVPSFEDCLSFLDLDDSPDCNGDDGVDPVDAIWPQGYVLLH